LQWEQVLAVDIQMDQTKENIHQSYNTASMINNELIQLLSLEIPIEPKKEIGFLEIAGMAHYENVNSRIYAYFLNQSNSKELSSLFLNALYELIIEKSSRSIELDDFSVTTEELTVLGNRIDITLNDQKGGRVIIIENKIYHILNNDLLDYWNHFKYSDENKVGILLTLYPYTHYEHSDKFINITHLEWTTRIKTNGLPYGLPDKIYTYLNDFFRTIEYLTKRSHMNEQTKFYFEHTQKILLAKQASDEANNFLIDQMNVLASKLSWETYGTGTGWRNIWDKNNHCDSFYTIYYQPLIDGHFKVSIIIELINEDMKNENHLIKLLNEDELYKKMGRGISGKNYLQFAFREYELTLIELEVLADTLFNIIQRDFEPVMNKILAEFYPNHYTLNVQ
jgi:hypothetical protein